MKPNIDRGGLEFRGPEDELKLKAVRTFLAERALDEIIDRAGESLLYGELSLTDEHTGTFLSAESVETLLHLLPRDPAYATTKQEMSAGLGQLYTEIDLVRHMTQAAIQHRESAQQAAMQAQEATAAHPPVHL